MFCRCLSRQTRAPRRSLPVVVLLLGLSLSLGAQLLAVRTAKAQWPQFLGPQRNGISAETGLVDRWPADGLKVLWRTAGGVGMSGLAIEDGRLVTLVQSDGKQWALALNAADGQRQWRTEVAPEFKNSMGDGPRATPAIDGSRVFVFTGQGVLAALDVRTGKLLWSRNVVEELEAKVADYGMACSPLVVGDLVIVTAGAPQGTVAAWHKETGERVWTAGNDSAGYSSPALLQVGGRSQLVVLTGSSVLGLSPQQGTILWRYPYVTDYDCNIATPLAIGQHVFISSGESHGSVLLALRPSGERFEPQEVWSSQGTRSVLRNEWQTSILLGGHLYGLDNVGSAGPVTHLACIDAATGQRVWQQPRFGKSNLIAADGKLFFTTMKGEVVVVRAAPDGYQELGRQQVTGSTRQAPALAEGRLYLRDDAEVVCLDVRGSSAGQP
ncbi:MAG: PQQ-binding-like beta-propeller repeat protein [Pirellulaceae bacterium]|nr:PQQ-binding-like beta-propeller repeat protein [Pirellulaceae bacterium]